MDRAKWPAIIGLTLGTVYLSTAVPRTFAFDRPLLSATTCLVILGYCLIGLARLLRKDGERLQHESQRAVLPWNIVKEIRALRQPPRTARDASHSSSSRRLRAAFLILIAALVVRIHVFIAVLSTPQCAIPSLEPLLPLVLAALDAWSTASQGQGKLVQHSERRNEQPPILHSSQYRRLLCVTLISCGSVVALAVFKSPTSTYICPATLNPPWLIPFFQLAGTATDLVIIYLISKLLRDAEGRPTDLLGSRIESVGKALIYGAILCGIVFLVTRVVYAAAFAGERSGRNILTIPRVYIWSLLESSLAFCFTSICVMILMSQADATTVTIIPTLSAMCAITLPYTWSLGLDLPLAHYSFGLVAFCVATTACGVYFHSYASVQAGASHSSPLIRKKPIWLYLILLSIVLVQLGLWMVHRSSVITSHPIDLLLHEAQVTHDAYVDQASSSKTLSEAVKTYRRRYGRAPPPAFDHWYQYATARNSVIIDDYDSIHRDLRQFYALSPAQIREDTWRMISNPWHDASGLIIRSGKVTIAPNVMPTHRWMLEGVVRMINPFAEWLPDMDLALNVNDEPRVAQPYAMAHARENVLTNDLSKAENSFSDKRAEQWKPVAKESVHDRYMISLSRHGTFYEFGSNACPPDSRSRSQRLWDVQRLCSSCAAPHSIGPFLSNWTMAADICNQPDLANLHGLYISPASFKPTSRLYPIFSQSKAYGFSDILYPSAWNYIDKTKYAPKEDFPDVPYLNKNHTMFWRGGTTEGISHDFGHWKGMTRQRFVHLASPLHTPSSSFQTLLVPRNNLPTSPPEYKYTSVSTRCLKDLIPTDINFVGQINRCNGLDCVQQEHEFAPLATRSDFQYNWQYKFLLDMDGAGFSGRFLPFLHSHSLPFKAALYREWWADRVTAWQHFVPLDLRGQGFWATLAYFSGLDGKVNGRLVQVEARNKEGEKIAESGREWAGRVLRKEDMEIYMFRLLLEWGRMTDDKRDGIGFVMEGD